MARAGSFSGIFKTREELAGEAESVLVGAPYDGASSFRPGARLAPAQIRRMAESLNACTERGVDLSGSAARDDGDLSVGTRLQSALTRIEAAVGRILDEGAVPIVLGGDHIVTLPAFQAALARYPNLKLLYLDAHPDLYAEYEGDAYSHACVAARILDLEGMDGQRITQAGIRAVTPEQREAARRAGICIVPAWEFSGLRYVETGPLYLSVDIDVLDPAYAPGV